MGSSAIPWADGQSWSLPPKHGRKSFELAILAFCGFAAIIAAACDAKPIIATALGMPVMLLMAAYFMYTLLMLRELWQVRRRAGMRDEG